MLTYEQFESILNKFPTLQKDYFIWLTTPDNNNYKHFFFEVIRESKLIEPGVIVIMFMTGDDYVAASYDYDNTYTVLEATEVDHVLSAYVQDNYNSYLSDLPDRLSPYFDYVSFTEDVVTNLDISVLSSDGSCESYPFNGREYYILLK